MRQFLFSLLFYAIMLVPSFSQDTFSIVAVDPETGEAGSAGASCVDNADAFGGVILLSGIIPGKGGINAQATICIPHVNLNNGIAQMEAGLSPQEILDYLWNNDACNAGNLTQRQYGVVDFDDNGQPRSAPFTGANCLDYAGHRTGDHYAIQGNILLGPEILDSMEARFLSTPGPLAHRLMAAMQGANVPGADIRCSDEGTSSKSSFIRVARPNDTAGQFYLELNVALAPNGVEPIDSLQVLFDEWKSTISSTAAPEKKGVAKVYPNPSNQHFTLEWSPETTAEAYLVLTGVTGKMVLKKPIEKGLNPVVLPPTAHGQVYILQVQNEAGAILFSEKLVSRPY